MGIRRIWRLRAAVRRRCEARAQDMAAHGATQRLDGLRAFALYREKHPVRVLFLLAIRAQAEDLLLEEPRLLVVSELDDAHTQAQLLVRFARQLELIEHRPRARHGEGTLECTLWGLNRCGLADKLLAERISTRSRTASSHFPRHHLMALRLVARSSPARHASRLLAPGSRSLCSSMHDDFKPQRKSYAAGPDGVKEQIGKDIEENKVVVFMKGVPDAPMCGFSNTVVQVLKAEGVEFKGLNVLADEDLRQGIKDYSKWPTVPQVPPASLMSAMRARSVRRCQSLLACVLNPRSRFSSGRCTWEASSSVAATPRWRCTSPGSCVKCSWRLAPRQNRSMTAGCAATRRQRLARYGGDDVLIDGHIVSIVNQILS